MRDSSSPQPARIRSRSRRSSGSSTSRATGRWSTSSARSRTAQLVCGLHVHVGMESFETCLRTLAGIRPWLDGLLLLSANSPYLAGEETGELSSRLGRLRQLPRGGPPPPLATRGGLGGGGRAPPASTTRGSGGTPGRIRGSGRSRSGSPTRRRRSTGRPLSSRSCRRSARRRRRPGRTCSRPSSRPRESSAPGSSSRRCGSLRPRRCGSSRSAEPTGSRRSPPISCDALVHEEPPFRALSAPARRRAPEPPERAGRPRRARDRRRRVGRPRRARRRARRAGSCPRAGGRADRGRAALGPRGLVRHSRHRATRSSPRSSGVRARALARTGAGRPTSLVLFRETSVGGTFAGLGGVQELGRWVTLRSGRLPRTCTPERCEVLRLRGRAACRGSTGSSLVEVGEAALENRVLFGDFLAPTDNALADAEVSPSLARAAGYHRPPPPPLFLAEGVAALAGAPALERVYRSYAWVAPLGAGPPASLGGRPPRCVGDGGPLGAAGRDRQLRRRSRRSRSCGRRRRRAERRGGASASSAARRPRSCSPLRCSRR